jgi:hypothetical protein
MLNELLIIERGAYQAGIPTIQRHPDVKDTRRIPTLLVQLDQNGHVACVLPVPKQVKPWTLRSGQHNSFPFVQPKVPLWTIPIDTKSEALRKSALSKKNVERRKAFLELAENASFNQDVFKNWPGAGFISHLKERRQQLAGLEGTESDVVPASIDCFLIACSPENGASQLMAEVAKRLVEEIERSPQDECLEVASALLLGSFDIKNGGWQAGAALIFEASGKNLSILDHKLIPTVSDALSFSSSGEGCNSDICGLTGNEERLVTGNFPQPNLPILGQTYVFSKNRDIPAFDRYARFSGEAMPVGNDVAMRLAASIAALTSVERKNKTWRDIPGEAPKQTDLLVAFVEAVPGVQMAEVMVEDYSEEEQEDLPDSHGSVAVFEQRTERMIRLVKAEVGENITKTNVQIAVFRKVDLGNRKVVHSATLAVAGFYEAGKNWVRGERNVPGWLTLPILAKGESKPKAMHPPHIAPLGLIGFSRSVYIRGGIERQDASGIPAAEALSLFLDPSEQVRSRVKRMLRLVLTRRAALLSGVGHLQHMPGSWDRRFEIMKRFDCRETLRTVTLLGILLDRLGRVKEQYMKEAAFKLGQLLAAADVVHAGYCADVRGGDIPSSLLGNQVFGMAQIAPTKALATLCRRWKPYGGWAKKAAREPYRIDAMIASKEKDERKRKTDQQRGWDIKRALRHAREMGPLADELASTLADTADDAFRAELLLGYMAGLPKKEDSNSQELNQ